MRANENWPRAVRTYAPSKVRWAALISTSLCVSVTLFVVVDRTWVTRRGNAGHWVTWADWLTLELSERRIAPYGDANEMSRPDEAISKSMLSTLDDSRAHNLVMATNLEHGGRAKITPQHRDKYVLRWRKSRSKRLCILVGLAVCMWWMIQSALEWGWEGIMRLDSV